MKLVLPIVFALLFYAGSVFAIDAKEGAEVTVAGVFQGPTSDGYVIESGKDEFYLPETGTESKKFEKLVEGTKVTVTGVLEISTGYICCDKPKCPSYKYYALKNPRLNVVR